MDGFEREDFESYQAKIMVIGCGGGGCNTITRLNDIGIRGATTVAVNTDAKHLAGTRAGVKVLIGRDLTGGLGAGGYPDVGSKAAEESKEELKSLLRGCDLLFVTCGLGGGTGTGSLPVISKYAKESGAIVIAPVTYPFRMEGARTRKAEEGLLRAREYADTTIIIENQKLLELAGNKPLKEAFEVADDLIATMIKGVTELISEPSLVNLDYADVRAIMNSGGVATIGIGTSDTRNRASEAIEKALSHPLLDVQYEGATGALIQIKGGKDLRLDEISVIGEAVSRKMGPDAVVMWGAKVAHGFEGKIQVIAIITGVTSPGIMGSRAAEQKSNVAKMARSFQEMGIRLYA